MKAIIETGCIACGLCEKICPQIFEMKDTAEIKADADFEAHTQAIKDAAECCPVEVIKILNS